MDGEGWYYIAEGTWDLLGTDPLAPKMRVCEEGRIRMVAGGGFEPFRHLGILYKHNDIRIITGFS